MAPGITHDERIAAYEKIAQKWLDHSVDADSHGHFPMEISRAEAIAIAQVYATLATIPTGR